MAQLNVVYTYADSTDIVVGAKNAIYGTIPMTDIHNTTTSRNNPAAHI